MRDLAGLISNAALATLTLTLAACDSHLDAEVGGATLPQALAVSPAGAGPTVVILPDRQPAALPAGPVRLAIDLRTPWPQVQPLLDGAAATGSQPILLVGQRNRVRAFSLDDPPVAGPAIKLVPEATGKFCLSPPGTREAYCVQAGDRRHISSMYVREAIRKAVAEYDLTVIRVEPKGDVAWGDLIRTVDGARTCCQERPVTLTVAR